MAETHSPLSQLADISEPPLVLGFAFTPIWWLLSLVLITGLFYVALRFYKRWRFYAAKRQALQLLEQASVEKNAASMFNQLIKRVLVHYQPAHPALSLNSKQWQQWLAAQQEMPLPDLTRLLYQAGTDRAGTEQFYQFAKVWLTHYNANAPLVTPQKETSNA